MAKKDIRATRRHKTLKQREKQLGYNLMAAEGGKPYIDARLSRFPCETDVSWGGTGGTSTSKEGSWSSDWYQDGSSGHVTGRKDRAFCINYARRIIAKINQYVFGGSITRKGINAEFEADTTKTGMSVNSFMTEVSAAYTAGQWCWISIDRGAPVIDEDGKIIPQSLKAREDRGDRIFWMLWHSNQVVDWRFDGGGELVWLITEQEIYDNEDYTKEATTSKVRTIWERGKVTRLWLDDKDSGKIIKEEEVPLPFQFVPFIPVGVPSASPWWFDDVERVQASLLDLDSAHNENLIQTVYPQLVLPDGMIDNVMRLAELSGVEGYKKALEMVRGLHYPILEPADSKDISRYLTPASSDLKAIPDEILRRRKELFQIVGLAMQGGDGNQVASAASKAWDNLDPSNTMRNRATLLEEAEEKAILMSKLVDSTFTEYDPEYPRQFDIPAPAEDIKTLVELSNVDLPDSGRREIMRASVKLLSTLVSVPQDRMDTIMQEIEDMDLGDIFGKSGEPTGAVDDIGKIPLVVQQLALAAERAAETDPALAAKLRAKMNELIDSIGGAG